VAGKAGNERGSGGMASKLAAAKIAAWSGVRAVIASASVSEVIIRAVNGEAVGTMVRPRAKKLASRKLWIAFAQGAHGRLVVDDGARRALVESGRSLLPAGVRAVEGSFDADDAVEVIGPDGRLHRQESYHVACGLVRHIREFCPQVILTFGPEGGLTGHTDHSMASVFGSLAFQ